MKNNSQPGPVIALSGVNLSLGHGAARVHILKDIDLHPIFLIAVIIAYAAFKSYT